MKRKHSAPDDDRHHDRHSKVRRAEEGHSKSHSKHDPMMRMVFRPIKDSLKRVQSATKENIKSQKERAIVMKEELVTIGNFIKSLAQEEEGKGFEKAFW